jgi:hypothetical protein
VVEDGLVRPPADDAEIVTAARDRLLAEEWDLAVVVTDLPLSVDRRTVVAHASPVHGVAVLSLPALGAVARRRRALQTTVGLLRILLGADTDGEGDPAALRRRVRELATDPATPPRACGSPRGCSPATCGCWSARCAPTGRGG